MKKTPFDNYVYRSIPGEKTEWRADWITSKRFFGLAPRILHENVRDRRYASENKNIHTIFCKDFSVSNSSPVKKALLFISADDICKVYINSSFVGEGPAQSYPWCYNYNCFDVTDLVKKGENFILVHVYYQGLYNISLVSADELCGMIAQLEITFDDGTKQIVTSGNDWKYCESNARTEKYVFGYETQFSEDIDLNKADAERIEERKDTSLWDNACISNAHHTLFPQITPAVKHETVYPASFEKKGDTYFIDFGKEFSGTLCFFANGKKGDVVDIALGEELDENGRVRYELRANCTYREFVTLSGKEELVEFFEYKGYRYAEISGLSELSEKDVMTLSRSYPFPEQPARFSCTSKLLEDIWSICAHGVKVGTQDTYLDCPTREKGGFLGDALISGMSHLILTGDLRIYKKFLLDCESTSEFCPALTSHVPSYVLSSLADYSLLFPLFLEHYYNNSGELEFIRRLLPLIDGILSHYSAFEDEHHLLCKVIRQKENDRPNPAILVDWPPELRDDYDFEKAEQGVCTPVNVLYYGFLKKSAKLFAIAGENKKSQEYAEKAELVEKSIITELYDESKGLFIDARGSSHFGLHANALQLFCGLEPPKGFAPMVELIKKKRLSCGVYFAYFVIKGLYNIGESELAFDLLSGKDENSWYNMLANGATTCMEVWGPDKKWNTSWCHPWSSSPISFFVMDILGINLGYDGGYTVKIKPNIPDSVDGMSADIPVACGRIKASFSRRDGRTVYNLSVPENTKVIFEKNDNIVFCMDK